MFPVEVLTHIDALSIFALSAEPIFQSNDYYPLGKAAGMCKRAFSAPAPALEAFLLKTALARKRGNGERHDADDGRATWLCLVLPDSSKFSKIFIISKY